MSRWILILSLAFLSGCDVATLALIMGNQDNSSSDDDGAPLPSPPSTGFAEFRVWVAFIDPATAIAARTELFDNKGEPLEGGRWTRVLPDANTTHNFNPDDDPVTINAILIQVSSLQNFEFDAVEVLDGQNRVVEHAEGTPYFNLVQDTANLMGPPDGVKALTTAQVDDVRAFIFTLYDDAAGIDRFRVNGHGAGLSPNPGEVVAVGGGLESFGNERPGGLAIRDDGLIHVTLSIEDTGRLSRYNLAGVRQDFVPISLDLATLGSHSVAVNSAGVIFTSCSNGTGVIQVLRFADDLTPGNSIGFTSGFNGDRVEHNSIAVDSLGNIVVVGGFSSLISGRNHWTVKIPESLTGAAIWPSSSTSLDSSSTTYWHAVAAGADEEVLITGDLGTPLFGGTVQIYSTRFDSGGTPVWEHELQEGELPADVGHSIAVDLDGNVYVAGSVGTDIEGRDAVLLRYEGGDGVPAEAEYSGETGQDAEALDVAVDLATGAIYVVGYEMVPGQGENWWIRKYIFSSFGVLTPVWQRTHDGVLDNDRAVSCAIHENNLVVAGYETNGTGQTKFVLRVYEK